jgi:hypothetical protein
MFCSEICQPVEGMGADRGKSIYKPLAACLACAAAAALMERSVRLNSAMWKYVFILLFPILII